MTHIFSESRHKGPLPLLGPFKWQVVDHFEGLLKHMGPGDLCLLQVGKEGVFKRTFGCFPLNCEGLETSGGFSGPMGTTSYVLFGNKATGGREAKAKNRRVYFLQNLQMAGWLVGGQAGLEYRNFWEKWIEPFLAAALPAVFFFFPG